MKFKIYKLHFKSPLHIADDKVEYSISHRFIHSDTLIAAFCWMLSEIGLQQPENCQFPFVISSLFPFYQKAPQTEPKLFLPIPNRLKNIMLTEEQLTYRKSIKKVKWAELKYFEELINGKSIVDLDFALFKGQFLTDLDLKKDYIFKTEVFPRVKVPRSGKDKSEIFFVEKVYFNNYSGLFFIAYGEDFSLIDNLLELLKYNGIGTDKNLGLGRFEFTSDTIDLNLPEADTIMSLSLFLPAQEEFNLINNVLNYSLIRRSGWITREPYHSIRRNPVYMFEEASIFKYSNTDKPVILGTSIDVTPDFIKKDIQIYRSGKALFIPIKLQ